jgi:hypothetical protein
MVNSMPVLQPLGLARPRSAHRLEAFSLKLARRVTLSRHVALQQWVLLEASPAVETLCERPGLIIIDGQQILAEVWVQSADRSDLVAPCEQGA